MPAGPLPLLGSLALLASLAPETGGGAPVAMTRQVAPAAHGVLAAPTALSVRIGDERVSFELRELDEFRATAVEIHRASGVERTTVDALGVRVLRGASGHFTLAAVAADGVLRGEVVDHRDGALHALPAVGLGQAAAFVLDASPVESTFACGTSDDPTHDHHAHPTRLSLPADGGVAGASCRRECVFLIDTDYLHYQNYGGTPAAAAASVLLAVDTVDAVYEKHVGTSFTTSAIIIRADQASDPYAGLTAAGSLLDLARVIWTGTTEYERDLVHMFSGTDGSDGIGGVAWVGVVCNSFGVGMSRFASSNVFCHEVGHNFGAGHCADEPCDTMCGGCLWMGPNDKIIMTTHRDGVGCLAEDPSPDRPIPPDAQIDIVSVAGGTVANALEVRANDTDYSCEPTMIGAVGASSAGATITIAGAAGEEVLLYTPPAGFVGLDRFTYTLVDADGLTDDAEVRVSVTTPDTVEVGRGCASVTQSLQVAADLADPVLGAEILVGPGRYGPIDFRGKPIRLRATHGPLATFIDGGGARGLAITGAAADGALVEGFTFHNCAAETGGAILVDGADATIRNCRFIATVATSTTSGGGAIRARQGTVLIEDCAFLGTSASSGGAIRTESGDFTIRRSDFDGCAAIAGNGGAVLATGLGQCRVIECTVRSSTATGTGGGVRFEGGATGQVGQTSLCGGAPNNLSGAYTNLGGNASASTCAACDAIAWRAATDCDGDGAPDHCAIAANPALDANGDGLLDACPTDADLLVAIWSADCGGNGSAFEVVRPASSVNWSTAAAQAVARGGRLATITSQAEADFVYGRLVSIPSVWSGTQGPWLGLQRTGGVWKWITGETVEFNQWAPGEPNGSGDRGRYWNPSGVSPTWDDQPGSSGALSYLVEYPDAADCNANGLPDARDIALGFSTDADGDGQPDECAAPPCPADLFADGSVDAADLAAMLAAWGTAAADLDGDGTTTASDLAILLGAWGPCR
ncbi:MAG: hypothetical protein RI967_2460 [Planctomycetota bacterium]